MKILTTAPNIQSTLTLRSTGHNAALNRWEIVYRVTRHTIEPRTPIDFKDEPVYLRNAPAQTDENGDITTTATNELSDFTAAFTTFDELIERSLETAVAHARHKGTFTPYVDEDAEIWAAKLIDEGEPAPDWMPGETILPGYVRTHNGVKKRAIYKHVSGNDIPFDNTAIWVTPGEQKQGLMTKLKNLFK